MKSSPPYFPKIRTSIPFPFINGHEDFSKNLNYKKNADCNGFWGAPGI